MLMFPGTSRMTPRSTSTIGSIGLSRELMTINCLIVKVPTLSPTKQGSRAEVLETSAT